MRTSRLTLVLTLALASLPSPRAQPLVDTDVVQKIRREGLDNSQVYATFSHLVTVIGPRLTATPGYKTAADWARDRLEAWGLRDARLESFEFGRGWALEKFTLEMIEPYYMPLMGYPEAWSASMTGEVEAPPLFIGGKSPEELEAMAARLMGAILLSQPMMSNFVREDRPQPTAPGYTPPAQRESGRGRGGRGAAGESPAQRRARILREAGPAVVLRTSRGEHG